MIIYKSALDAVGGDACIDEVITWVQNVVLGEIGAYSDTVASVWMPEADEHVVEFTMKNGRKFALLLAEIV